MSKSRISRRSGRTTASSSYTTSNTKLLRQTTMERQASKTSLNGEGDGLQASCSASHTRTAITCIARYARFLIYLLEHGFCLAIASFVVMAAGS
ncbi:hypothetical protein FKP32DRAFT_918131 [Trametes sanguinea]|nr:hypothetical protein FKP32DRAFT_918131 [Trametes sanguinea]